jgi:hypothetical protein
MLGLTRITCSSYHVRELGCMVEQGITGHANYWTYVTPASDFSNTDGKGTTGSEQSQEKAFVLFNAY